MNRQTFGGDYEADLVARLRSDGLVAASLVAEANDRIIGHLLLSWIGTEVEGRAVRTLALAPMAVLPSQQRQGTGSRLVEAGIMAARQAGAEAIIVVGHTAFYPRFGFSAALARKLNSPFAGEAFMALELMPGALAGEAGSVTYTPAFAIPWEV